MKLYVARHGQTNYNDLCLCNSDPSTDVHLTEVGIEQAKKLAVKLKNVNIQTIFVSELKRTKQTADIVNKYHNRPIVVDARLNDNRSGFENQHYLVYNAELEKADDKWSVRLNDGESINDVKKRVKSFLDYLKSNNSGPILIVTSLVIIQQIYAIINNSSNQEAWDFIADKASCTEFNL